MDAENKGKDGHVAVKSRRSELPFVLCMLLILVTLVAMVLAVYLGLCAKGLGLWAQNICQSRECVRAAARITSYMDETVDPCHDFYQYACGGYEKSHTIPPGAKSASPWNTLGTKLQSEMKTLLEQPSKIDNLSGVKQAKNYYRSCMNVTYLNKLGIEPLKKHIKDKGGWALVEPAWKGDNFNLEDYMAKIAADSKDAVVIAYKVWANPKNSTQNILIVGQGILPLGNRDYYKKPKDKNVILQSYEKSLTYLGVQLGGDAKKIKSKIEKLINLDIAVANITTPPASRELKNIKLMTTDQATKTFKGIDFTRLINGYLKPVKKKVGNSDLIGVLDEAYLLKIGAILKKTPKETLASYIMWGAINVLVQYTDKKTRSLGQGQKPELPRYQTCTSTTNTAFYNIVARLFVDKYMKEGTSDIEDLTKRIKKVFRDNLNKVDWLDAKTRKEAAEKLKVMKEKLGYPRFIMNNAALEKVSAGTEPLQADQYLANGVKVLRAHFNKEISLYNTSVNNDVWFMPPVMVNAFYNPSANTMVVPVGILQPPFYDQKGLKALNYGTMGMTIGHEITHGFDSSGRLFDKKGNKRDWWTHQSTQKFLTRSQCVLKQYANFTIKGLGTKVNGKLTLAENIADIGAIKQSFQAYKTWVGQNSKEKPLPGIKLNPDKLFFLSFAQLYCHVIKKEKLYQLATTDNHTPMRERVYGTLINSEHFSKTFKCPQGSRMNPKQKCAVW